MDYGKLTRDLVADAIKNKLPGLNTTVVIHYLVAQGGYDAVSGTYANTTVDSDPIAVVAARPTMEDVQNYGVVATDVKLIVPGASVDHEINVKTTVTMGGKKWDVKKATGVPGGSVWLVFVRKT